LICSSIAAFHGNRSTPHGISSKQLHQEAVTPGCLHALMLMCVPVHHVRASRQQFGAAESIIRMPRFDVFPHTEITVALLQALVIVACNFTVNSGSCFKQCLYRLPACMV
jgi:hypothetical protein